MNLGRVDRESLSEEAWAMLEQATHTGHVTLASGETVELPPKELATILRWLASQSSNKIRKPIGAPDRFLVPPTVQE